VLYLLLLIFCAIPTYFSQRTSYH